jgi:putative endopeptidase
MEKKSAGRWTTEQRKRIAALEVVEMIWRKNIVLAILALTAACPNLGFAQTPKNAAAESFAPLPGFDKSVMDTSADPCSDFYQYACGNFAKVHPIPSDMPWFDQFANLYEFNTAALRSLVEKAAAAGDGRSANEQKIGDYYSSCLDTDAIEKKGLAPIQPELDKIAGLKNKHDLPELIAHFNRMEVGMFLDFGSQQDYKDASREIAYADQGGLGLPEKDYYSRTDAKSEEIRKQYVQHLTNVLKLLGEPADKAAADAQKVMAMETEMAKSSMGVVERRDPLKVYHMMSVTRASFGAPELQVERYIDLMGAPKVSELNVVSPDFFKGLNQVIQQTDLDTLKTYMKVRLTDSMSMRLPKAFDDENFDFYGRKLTGTPEQEARWKRCVNGTDASLGEALGQLYVQQYFTPDMKAKTLQMVHDIEAAMDKDLDGLDWMGPQTKVKAKEKLHAVADKIGYPDKWRDYSKLTIIPGDAVGNSMRVREFTTAFNLNKIDKPVDRGLWEMSPPTVNAYYDPSMNDINFPAGILQPAFYDKNASDATNFGHIGAVVGHELTHGFDDEGAKFDAKGNLSDWWTAEDKKKFEDRTGCLADEYGSFTAVDDVKVNGKLTLGENTADNGGLRLAMMAMLARAAQSGLDLNAKTEGYTPAQQLFLGYAQNYCTDARPEMLRMLAQTDPHSPDMVRVKGPLVNMPEFAKAFSCKTGQPMAPAKQCHIW